MDHLPHIQDPAYPLDLVPCLVTSPSLQYTGPNLSQFPNKYNLFLGNQLGEDDYDAWSLYPQPDCTLIDESLERKGAFIQAWLFFGPLIEICSVVGLRFDLEDFVRQEGPLHVLSTSKLENFLQAWANVEGSTDIASLKSARAAQILNILETVQVATGRNLCLRDAYRRRWSLSKTTVVAVQLLNKSLMHAWSMIYHDGAENLGYEAGGGNWAQLSEDRMRQMGWCPSEIVLMQQKFSATGRYFASRLRRRTLLDQPHNGCSETACHAFQVKTGTYVTRHSMVGCACEHIAIDVDKVRHILYQGMIPRIRITPAKHEGGLAQLSVESSGDYTALSHVWAYGLGNEKTNSLPNCQLQRLLTLTRSLDRATGVRDRDEDDSALIWIDTLCVPLGEGRNTALGMMRQTYIDACAVLVIDEELCHESWAMSIEELCIRLVLCAWSRRLWTFEEGFVAGSRLHIQFKEGTKQYSSLAQDYRPMMHSPLRYECVAAAAAILPKRENTSMTGTEIIKLVTEACKHRTTSRLTDETVVLASTADLDAKTLLECESPDGRMRAFLLQCQQIPANVIFFDGPKLETVGFRWAPYSFLYPLPSSTILSGENQGICSTDGLTASWPSIALQYPVGCSSDKAELYYFRSDDMWVYIASRDSIQRNMHGRDADTSNLKTFRRLPQHRSCVLLFADADSMDSSAAVVSALPTEAGQTRRAEFLVNVVVGTYPIDSGIFAPDRFDPVRCIEIAGGLVDTLEWCVS